MQYPGEYIMDQQTLKHGQDNIMSDKLWNYITRHTVDTIVVRGTSASLKSKVLNTMLQQSIGRRVIQYVTRPDNPPKSTTSSTSGNV